MVERERPDLDAIELRLRMATPGPWHAPAYRYNVDSLPSYNNVVAEHANICGLHDGGQTRDRIDANAQFIAHAPSDVASLVAEVHALGVECEELREALRAVLPWIPTGTVAAQRARSLLDRAAVPVPGPPRAEQ